MSLNFGTKKIAVLLLAGIISTAGSGTALAANQSNSRPSTQMVTKISGIYKSVLDDLVTAGTITQEQADAITASMPGKGTTNKGNGFLSQLVTAGTITQDQANSIQTAMKSARDSKESMSTVLAGLVSSGTITQEQADAITASMTGKDANRGNGFLSKLVTAGTITQDQANSIQTAMKSARDSKESMSTVLAELVSSGTITQEQADAITASMTGKGTTNKGNGFLSKLVTAGTITQDQANSIQTAMKSARDSKESMSTVLAGLVSSDTITQEQADAITANVPGKNANKGNGFLSQLVTAGTITQDQADAVTNAFKAALDATNKSE